MQLLYREFSARFCAVDFRGMDCIRVVPDAEETPGLLLKVDSHREVQKTVDIHPPKTGISTVFCKDLYIRSVRNNGVPRGVGLYYSKR